MYKIWRAKKCRAGIPFRVPVGARVEIVKNYPKRRVLIKYKGELILTYQACLKSEIKGVNMVKLPTVKCRKCGNEWIPRVKNPPRCPKCHTRRWHKAKEG